MSNKKEKSKNYWQGVNDKSKGKSNPPSKGTSKAKSTLIGFGTGLALDAVTGGGASLVGAALGYLAGDNKKELQKKKSNNSAYNAGNKNRKK
jgi:hypothetical protein